MKTFRNLVAVDRLNLTPEIEERIQGYSHTPVLFPDTDPASEEELVSRIGDADGILISWRTVLSKHVLDSCPTLDYIGACCTSLANIAADEAKARNITVSNVADYGDEATAEYIFLQLLSVVRGVGPCAWDSETRELYGKRMGIVGLGAVGTQVARLALGFGMQAYYTSRTRKPEWEEKGLVYASLDELLACSDVISLHVPKDTHILTQAEFDLIPAHTIVVNTCLGVVFEPDEFARWIEKGENIAIFDRSSDPVYFERFRDAANVVFGDVVAGYTLESRQRLGEKVARNISHYLKNAKGLP